MEDCRLPTHLTYFTFLSDDVHLRDSEKAMHSASAFFAATRGHFRSWHAVPDATLPPHNINT